jgi:SAM-dependent methyltransferase
MTTETSMSADPAAAGNRDEPVGYALGASRAERQRLLAEAEQLSPLTEQLLDQVGLAPGTQAVDIGCGPLGILHLLRQRVGNAGQVMGLDADPVMIECARQVAIERRLEIDLALGDASSTGLPRSSFDFVHARLLLVNILTIKEVVEEMVALARPGGVAALQEVDIEYFVCDPPDPQWEALRDLFVEAHRATGRDVAIGRRLERLLHDAGLVDVHSAAHVVKTVPGDPWHTNLPGLAQSARALISEANRVGDAVLERQVDEAHEYLARPDSTTAIAFWQAWGRKPDSTNQGGRRQ